MEQQLTDEQIVKHGRLRYLVDQLAEAEVRKAPQFELRRLAADVVALEAELLAEGALLSDYSKVDTGKHTFDPRYW